MSLARLALTPLRLRGPLLAKPLPAASLVSGYRFNNTAPGLSGKPMGGHALHFKIERYFAAAMLPLFPAAYFVHGPVMDALLTAAVALHTHWGIVAVMNDYGRPIVIGETAARLAIPFAYVLSILLLAGLLHFNINDVGLTKAFEMFYSL
uniref:Succinate dehydrogenase [ubiquinone] cytochrome b small subunit n=2 Tax=Panagrolaimus TaxID=55784 RepID=A0A914PND5_9BILA